MSLSAPGRFRGVAAVCIVSVGASFALPACESGAVDKSTTEADTPKPLVHDIHAAIDAVEEWYGAPQTYFEISATLQQVSLIVAVGDHSTTEQAFFVDGVLVEPAFSEGYTDEDPTFTAAEVDFNPNTIFRGISAELDSPVLIDFAITGSPDGVIYDATVASDEGGVLLVLLGPDGQVKAVQAS